MSYEVTISTMNALRSLGFQHDPRVISDECPGLCFDFGNLALWASSCQNLRYVEVVLFTGVLSSPTGLHMLQPFHESVKFLACAVLSGKTAGATHETGC
jgi:hypothetical protein